MKIKVSFKQDENEWTIVTLTVIDSDEFPTRRIFRGTTDYPDELSYTLSPSATNIIRKQFEDPMKAKAWANDQLEAIRVRLRNWFNRLHVEDYTITL